MEFPINYLEPTPRRYHVVKSWDAIAHIEPAIEIGDMVENQENDVCFPPVKVFAPNFSGVPRLRNLGSDYELPLELYNLSPRYESYHTKYPDIARGIARSFSVPLQPASLNFAAVTDKLSACWIVCGDRKYLVIVNTLGFVTEPRYFKIHDKDRDNDVCALVGITKKEEDNYDILVDENISLPEEDTEEVELFEYCGVCSKTELSNTLGILYNYVFKTPWLNLQRQGSTLKATWHSRLFPKVLKTCREIWSIVSACGLLELKAADFGSRILIPFLDDGTPMVDHINFTTVWELQLTILFAETELEEMDVVRLILADIADEGNANFTVKSTSTVLKHPLNGYVRGSAEAQDRYDDL